MGYHYVDERIVLQKAIQYALDRGWKPRYYSDTLEEKIVGFDIYQYGIRKVTFFNDDGVRFYLPAYEIIFNHSFLTYIWPVDSERMSFIVAMAMTTSPLHPYPALDYFAHHIPKEVMQ